MRIDPSRAKVLVENVEQVIQRIDSARGSRKVCSITPTHVSLPLTAPSSPQHQVRLIAVSKLKPASDILALHNSPLQITHFGENYSNELTTKASLLPRTIKWHMIGGLQTNKCKPLAESVPNLFCVSSVDTAKKADALEKGRAACVEKEKESVTEKLRVLVQVNTSGEESKSGVEPGKEAVELCRHVKEKCPSLRLAGLMTIGAIARSQQAATEEGRNEDFVTLKEVRDKVAEELGMEKEELELGMGMSADFEAAIRQGSDEVRIGTTIFGQRPPKKDAVIDA
jgi:pyridoxal phosphate enzyme (YggS family)